MNKVTHLHIGAVAIFVLIFFTVFTMYSAKVKI